MADSAAIPVTERRQTRRYDVLEDRAETLVIHNDVEHDGALCNTSAGGFSLMLLRTVEVEAGQKMRLVTDDGIHDCEVVHRQAPIENAQQVGLRRIADAPFMEMPVLQKAKRWIRHKTGGASPFMSLFCFAAFIAVCWLLVTIFDIGSREPDPELTEEQGFGSPRETISDKAGEIVDNVVDDVLDIIRGRHRRSLEAVLKGTGKTWAEAVEFMEITTEQEKAMMAALDTAANGDPESVSGVQARSIIMKELTSRQRLRLTKLLDEAARLLAQEGDDAGR